MIGDWIKARRKERGWSQAKLAEESGISLGYLKLLEINRRPNPGPEKLSQLAGAFTVSVDQLMQEAGLGTTLDTSNGEPSGSRLEDWVQAMVALAPTLSPTDRAVLLHTARAMKKAHN